MQVTALIPIGTVESEDFLNMNSIVRAYRDDVEFEVDGANVSEDGAVIELANGGEIILHSEEADRFFEHLYNLHELQGLLLSKIQQ